VINKNDVVMSEKKTIYETLQKLRKDDIIEVIRDIHSIMSVQYVNYSEEGHMSFDGFYKFYKDFGIFPKVITLIQMKNIFFSLSEILALHFNECKHKNSKDKSTCNCNSRLDTYLKKKDVINFDLFLDSLAIVSTFIKYVEHLEDHEKILYLMEKMNRSGGINISNKKTGCTFNSYKDFSSIFVSLKEKYPGYYFKKKPLSDNKIVMEFDKIFKNF
jgi:hypothetical protein